MLGQPLTQREREVLPLLQEGLTNQEIAERLVISYGTVKNHVHNIMTKVGAKRRRQLYWAAQNGDGSVDQHAYESEIFLPSRDQWLRTLRERDSLRAQLETAVRELQEIRGFFRVPQDRSLLGYIKETPQGAFYAAWRDRADELRQALHLVLDWHQLDTQAFVAKHGHRVTSKSMWDEVRALLGIES